MLLLLVSLIFLYPQKTWILISVTVKWPFELLPHHPASDSKNDFRKILLGQHHGVSFCTLSQRSFFRFLLLFLWAILVCISDQTPSLDLGIMSPCGTFTENAGICLRTMDQEKMFLWLSNSIKYVIVKLHKMSQISHQMLHLWHFHWGLWIMDYGLFRLGQTLGKDIKDQWEVASVQRRCTPWHGTPYLWRAIREPAHHKSVTVSGYAQSHSDQINIQRVVCLCLSSAFGAFPLRWWWRGQWSQSLCDMIGRCLEWGAGCLPNLDPWKNALLWCMQGTSTSHTVHRPASPCGTALWIMQ